MAKAVIDLVISGASKASGQLSRLESGFNKFDKALRGTSRNANKQNDALNKLSDQGLFNIQAGMVQLSTYSMILNQKISNTFDKMTNSFKDAENSLTQLQIKMGLASSDVSATTIQNYNSMEAEIRRLAATTQFTVPEVANAFDALIGAGNSAEESIKALGPALQYVSASAGKVDLAEGIDTVKLTTSTLNSEMKDLGANLNDIFVITQKTSLSFDKVYETAVGLKASFSSFKKDENLTRSLLTMAASMATIGQVGREGGDKINQFAGALNKMFSITEKGEMKGYGRKNTNRTNLLRLFGIGDISGKPIKSELEKKFNELGFTDGFEGLYNKIGKKGSKGQLMQDFILKNLLAEKVGDKYVLKSAEDVVDSLVTAYIDVSEREGSAVADALISSAMGGTKSSKLVMQGIMKQMGKLGVRSFKEMVALLKSNGNELSEAQRKALDTVQGQTKLLESAYDAMYQTIMSKDVFGKDALKVHRDLISTLDVMLKKYPSLAQTVVALGRSFQVFTGIATNLGFALTAMATLSTALVYAQKTTGLATKGLGATLGAFSRIFLVPTLSVLGSLTGGFLLVGLAIVGLMRYFTGAKTIGEGFSTVLQTISEKVKGITTLFKLSASEKFKGKSIKELIKGYKDAQQALMSFEEKRDTDNLTKKEIQKYTDLKTSLSSYQTAIGASDEDWKKFINNSEESLNKMGSLVDKFNSARVMIHSFVEGALTPLSAAMGVIVFGFSRLMDFLLFIPNLIASAFNYFSGTDSNSGTKFLGYFVGALLSIKIILFTVVSTVNLITGAWNGVGNAISGAATKVKQFNAGLNQQAKVTRYSLKDFHTDQTGHFKSYEDMKKSPQFESYSDVYGKQGPQQAGKKAVRTVISKDIDTLDYKHQKLVGTVDRIRLGWYRATGQTEKYKNLITKNNQLLQEQTNIYGRVAQTAETTATNTRRTTKFLQAGVLALGMFGQQILNSDAAVSTLGKNISKRLSNVLDMGMAAGIFVSLLGLTISKFALIAAAIAAVGYVFYDYLIKPVTDWLGLTEEAKASITPQDGDNQDSYASNTGSSRGASNHNDYRKIEQNINFNGYTGNEAEEVRRSLERSKGIYFNELETMGV
jgi:hypothetical protein